MIIDDRWAFQVSVSQKPGNFGKTGFLNRLAQRKKPIMAIAMLKS
jgi:hypothetical protein